MIRDEKKLVKPKWHQTSLTTTVIRKKEYHDQMEIMNGQEMITI
jgi:hypothetical protein